jgi:hypothetical protein
MVTKLRDESSYVRELGKRPDSHLSQDGKRKIAPISDADSRVLCGQSPASILSDGSGDFVNSIVMVQFACHPLWTVKGNL